ncbi:Alb1-domain-containing protein [Parachaetomium inaequale]|uniref:Alb1-domain-containing protein n=1 Tax=Parachaetomium inaequale TaxID=2588326 RepID=A0AAN6SUW2_9PEZI|nr:Alb1-domain-containing protein [Parachaetomium inaequale]
MAKGTITKGKKGPSLHSRAARRATSPGIDTDKSLKHVRPPQESVDRRPAVLAAHHAGGVTKKAKSGRKAVLSTRARRRQERSMDRAEAIMDRTAVKVQKSKGHAKVIFSRRKTWDEVNREAFDRDEERKLSKKAKAKMEEDAMVEAFYADDGDAEMEGAEDDGDATSDAVAAPAVSIPVQAVEEEEIL